MRNLFAVLILLAASQPVLAAEPVVCSITTSGTAASTASPTTGTCIWVAGSTVLMTCTADVYVNSTTTAGVAPVATSSHQPVLFTSNQDPVLIYLEPRDKVISVLQVTAAGTCKFMTVSTRRPFR